MRARTPSYRIDYSIGISFEWKREIDEACEAFFKSRRMKAPPTLKEIMHVEAIARQREKKAKGDGRNPAAK